MSSKPNIFPTFTLKKTPIKFGGFGNLFTHTHIHRLASLSMYLDGAHPYALHEQITKSTIQ